jgi:hypothetical protein
MPERPVRSMSTWFIHAKHYMSEDRGIETNKKEILARKFRMEHKPLEPEPDGEPKLSAVRRRPSISRISSKESTTASTSPAKRSLQET